MSVCCLACYIHCNKTVLRRAIYQDGRPHQQRQPPHRGWWRRGSARVYECTSWSQSITSSVCPKGTTRSSNPATMQYATPLLRISCYVRPGSDSYVRQGVSCSNFSKKMTKMATFLSSSKNLGLKFLTPTIFFLKCCRVPVVVYIAGKPALLPARENIVQQYSYRPSPTKEPHKKLSLRFKREETRERLY